MTLVGEKGASYRRLIHFSFIEQKSSTMLKKKIDIAVLETTETAETTETIETQGKTQVG